MDGAPTGPQVNELLTEHGIVTVNRPRAKSNPKHRGRHAGERKPAETLVEVKEIRRADGSVLALPIHERDGRLGWMAPTDEGERYMPLELAGIQKRRRKKTGRYDVRVLLALPPEIALACGKRYTTVALQETNDDRLRGYKRAGRVRAIAQGSEDFGSIYPKMRGEIESLNAVIEKSFYLNRARSMGWRGQQVDMMGLALMINALTRERMRKQSLKAAA